jgi:hypothetical protein
MVCSAGGRLELDAASGRWQVHGGEHWVVSLPKGASCCEFAQLRNTVLKDRHPTRVPRLKYQVRHTSPNHPLLFSDIRRVSHLVLMGQGARERRRKVIRVRSIDAARVCGR